MGARKGGGEMNWKPWDKSSEIGALLARLGGAITPKVGKKHTTSKYGHDAVREARKAERQRVRYLRMHNRKGSHVWTPSRSRNSEGGNAVAGAQSSRTT